MKHGQRRSTGGMYACSNLGAVILGLDSSMSTRIAVVVHPAHPAAAVRLVLMKA